MSTFVDTVAKLPKWSLIVIMAIPAYALFFYMAYNKVPVYAYSEQIQEVTIGTNEVGVMIDRDLTLCEERGGIVGKSGCIFDHPLKTGIHRIPITYDVEIMDTGVQTWEFRGEADE